MLVAGVLGLLAGARARVDICRSIPYIIQIMASQSFSLRPSLPAWARRSHEAPSSTLRAPSPVGSQYSVSERGFVRAHARRREKARSMIEASARAPRVYRRAATLSRPPRNGALLLSLSAPCVLQTVDLIGHVPAPAAFKDCPSPGLGKLGRATVRCARPTETGEEEGARVLLASDTDNPRDDFRD